MRPRRPKQYCLQLDIALWCKNQIEHSIWDESLLLSNCARSLEYSSSSTLAGLSYHICGKLEVAFKGSPSSQHQHCTDEAQKAETVLSAVIYRYIYINIYIYIYIYISISISTALMRPRWPEEYCPQFVIYIYKHTRQRSAVATQSFTLVGDLQATDISNLLHAHVNKGDI